MTTPPPSPPPSLLHDPQLRRIVLLIGYMSLAAGAVFAFALVWPIISTVLRILAPFLAALVVAYVMNPVVTFVEKMIIGNAKSVSSRKRREKWGRIGGVVTVFMSLLLIGGIFIGILVPILVTQIRSAYTGIESTAKQRAIPFVYEHLGFDTEPGAASVDTLRASVDDWVAQASADDDPEELRLRYSRLRREVSDWIAEVRIEPEDEENGRPRTETTEDDLQRLDGLIAHWRNDVREVAADRASLARTEPLERRVDDWIDVRRDYMAGNIQQPGWDDFQLRARSWLRDRGIDPEEALRTAATSDQARLVATEGVGIVGALFGLLIAAVMTLIGSAIFLFFVVLVSFYLLIDFHKLRPVMETLVPPKHEERVFDILGKIDNAVGGFLRGQIFVAFIVGTLTTIGLMFLGLRQYALLIGIVAGVANLVPYLGPIVGATPAVLWVLLTDSYDTGQERIFYLVVVLAMFAAIQSFESFVLQPKVIGKSASLHPVIVMAALVMGAQFGILGMIIAIPVVCILRVLLKEFYWDLRERDRIARRELESQRKSPTPKPKDGANPA